MDEQQLLCMGDPDRQGSLSTALQNKNFDHFRHILYMSGVDPEKVDPKVSISIFEKCCQTPGRAEFIRACIEWGCDVNKENDEFVNKRPINFAVESEDPDNLNALLENPHVRVDNIHEGSTPLQYLASIISDANFQNVSECIKSLIASQANVNIPNNRGLTPILTLAKKKVSPEKNAELLQHFLDNCSVDLDSLRDGEARKVLSKNFPQLILPEKFSGEIEWDFRSLSTALIEHKEQNFIRGLDKFLERTNDSDNRQNVFREHPSNETLLTLATRNGLANAVEKLLRCGDSPTNVELYGFSSKLTSPLELACIYGYWKILDMFLKSSKVDINSGPYLIKAIQNIGEQSTNKSSDFLKCFKLLVNYEGIDLNRKDDAGNTPLHVAVNYNIEAVALELLRRGAYIGSKNKFNELSINDIEPRILEKHFNNCIQTNGRRSGDTNYEIIFEYTNLVPSCLTNGKPSKIPTQGSTDEMAPIEYMAKSNELKHLVKHPLIASFLFLKWHRLAMIFYTNFFCYTIYCMSMIFFLLFCYGNEGRNAALNSVLYAICAMGGLYVFVRELMQFVISPRTYLKTIENWMEVTLIVMTVVVLSSENYKDSTRRTFAAITILLAVCEFFILTGSLPVLSFSTHLVMLKTVSKSFLKSLMLYSIILIAFALCFYTLLGKDGPDDETDRKVVAPKTDGEEEEEDGEFNQFLHPGLAIIKTVVMLTGEFDASDIKFNKNVYSYAIFLIFVFMISTVLFNLLNGLAVSDTQAIKSEAELMNFIYRAELMSRYEKILLGQGESDCWNVFHRRWTSTWISVFPDYLPLKKLSVLPNANNLVRIPIKREKYQLFDDDDIEDPIKTSKSLDCPLNLSLCCIFGNQRCSRMEKKIVKYAKLVLDSKNRENELEIERNELQRRIGNIENRIEQILQIVMNSKLAQEA
ncbi:hypothetical protein HA402_002419 [Bradysia odoriphaga]|nr:hypothetical protein HA402_002419 [Bradysia odoriphaga]